MIVAERLTKTFDDLKRGTMVAVDDVSFECRPGEVYGLLGLNGAGKSTAMRILSTVLKPTSGRAQVAGFDVVERPEEVRRRIGFLSNSTGLYDRMSAWEHVEYFGRLYGVPEDRLTERLESLFETLRMNRFRDLLVSKMSTGMRQKVSIARAIVHDPPVLIFDEPTLGLDVMVSRIVLETVLELRRQGKCIVYSTHIMREVEKVCDRVGIVHRGRLLETGTLDELRDRHRQRDLEEIFVAVIEEAERQAPSRLRN